MSEAPRCELDAGVRVRDRGRLLVGGTPPRLVRLSDDGAVALRALLGRAGPSDASATRGETTGGSAALAERLRSHGLLHPLPGGGAGEPPVTAIVPVHDGGERLSGLVATLAGEGPVIVVDDGSRDGSAARAEAAGARVLRHPSPRGPAAARNAGLAAAETEHVAFVDADCEVTPGWRRGLAGLFAADADLALVAPRVRSAPGDSPVARYEERGSPLDLGPSASLVGPRHRVTYLPAAALLARRDMLLELGGFDESMRFGEDVDLVWRLVAAGLRVRYAPSREVFHRPRPRLRGFAGQRASYGASAVDLVKAHGSAAAPLRAGRHGVAIWTAAALLGPGGLLAALAASTATVAARGDGRGSRGALAEVAIRGQAGFAVHLARVWTREWLPLSLAGALVSRRARAALIAALLLDSASFHSSAGRPAELPQAAALRLLDRSAYAAGLWWEMTRRRDFRALIPRP